ncbi:CHAPERONE-ACTIVITY OF BC1 COMPLEX CABC1 -RELATED [Salix purpurea]|uniref:CHAPERONE-ACTIVITY OF BC1 COMPLEX CABC1 -RELATED n=1 Tax=Salix purpurea TaxID=77065 RepID=A0A9Q0PBG5_SALPP|nr:CHAPERONE-ACTIVITY OF BC1 COMPLEX CABC1 -RELATED [Salix purpurea]
MLLNSSPSFNSFLFNSNSNFLSKNHKSQKSVPQTLRVVNSNDVDAFTEKSGYLFKLSSSEADSLNDYDLKKIAAIYKRKPFILLRRLFQIGSTFGRWLAARYVDSITEKSDLMFKIRAAELRQILLELGPAYIKIAQAVSSRPDLIPPSYLDELSLLQDRIAPFSTEVALNTIEQELGLPIDMIFSEISPEPTAAASLGQVYQARLRSNGQVVAVKVQRPGVQAAISLDILILHFIAGVVKKAGKLNSDLQAVVDEWASSLFREMDYIKEAKNGLKFRKLYGAIEDVIVPNMYVENTTRRVLVMEWVEGKKLSEVKDLYLVEVGVYCSFNQLLEYGFYHADPHPGNLLRTYDGKLAYIDFGMMGEFKQEFRDGFIEACLHLVNRDFEALAKDFVTLGLLPPTSDKEGVTKALTGVLQNAVAKGVSNISFGDLLGNLGTTMYKFKFQIPSYFSLVIRSLAVLEGIAIGFDPNYKVLGSTYPWIARKVLTDSSPQLRSSLQALLYEEGVFRIDRLESLLSESLRARTERVLVEDNDSKVAVKQILSFTLTEKGAFVREILLQEIAKGVDAFGRATLDSLTSMANTSIPFAASSSSSMTKEDMVNLRTFRRLMLLLAGLQKNGGSPVELKRTDPSKNQNMYSEEASLISYQFPSVEEILPILSVIPEVSSDVFIHRYNVHAQRRQDKY